MARNAKLINVPMLQFIDQARQAVTTNMPASAKVLLLGKTLTKPQLLAELEKQRLPYQAVLDGHSALATLLEKRDAADDGVLRFATGYTEAIHGTFGAGSDIDAKYAVPVRKTARALTAEQMVAKKAKALATRALRGTKGSREKADIKATGTFTVTVGAPSASPSAPAPIPVAQPVAAQPVAVAAPIPAPIATPIAAPVAVTNGAATNGAVAPMLMNGSGH